MVTFRSFRNSFLSTIGLGPSVPDIDALRVLCGTLLADVPAPERNAMLLRLEKMRRADDMWHLRGALFDTISRAHGESAARARLVILDEKLR